MTDLGVVVLVEDNPTDEELMVRLLKKQRVARQITVLRDGAEVLEYFAGTGRHAGRDLAEMPRLILLDLKLPLISGLEVLRHLKAQESTRAIPVVVLTSSQEYQDVSESYRLGVNSYVVKPLDFDRYMDAVHQLGQYWMTLNQPVNG